LNRYPFPPIISKIPIIRNARERNCFLPEKQFRMVELVNESIVAENIAMSQKELSELSSKSHTLKEKVAVESSTKVCRLQDVTSKEDRQGLVYTKSRLDKL